MHKEIKKVTSDIEEMKFNTSVAEFMKMTNEFYKDKKINKAEYKTFLQLLNPFAPHMTEEIYQILGETKTIAETAWPKYDETKTIDDEIEIPVQVNGKVKDVIKVPKDAEEEEVKEKKTSKTIEIEPAMYKIDEKQFYTIEDLVVAYSVKERADKKQKDLEQDIKALQLSLMKKMFRDLTNILSVISKLWMLKSQLY